MISELVFEDFLERNLNLIDPRLKLIERQFKIYKFGKIDLFCENEKDDLVIIEIKLYATPTAINQINWYKEAISKKFPNKKQDLF